MKVIVVLEHHHPNQSYVELIRAAGHEVIPVESPDRLGGHITDISEAIDQNPDARFLAIDGREAYEIKLRRTLEERGLRHLPLLVAETVYGLDIMPYGDDLSVSGCDFGNDFHLANKLVEILRNDPIRSDAGLVHNPQRYAIKNGVYVPVLGPGFP